MVDMMQVIKPVIAIIRNGVTDNEVIPSRASASIFLIGYFDSPAILSSRLYCTSIEGYPTRGTNPRKYIFCSLYCLRASNARLLNNR
uniref:Uncharacterized protein n=1 Tax=Klebsiella pneumoniae TaxID=573 RepID=Q762K3_KLEPN|nr:hypothetical protein [Klebsiella pneumoniae] [Klebsiella pneumoniae subsp. pneumoniae NTUH-K2044]